MSFTKRTGIKKATQYMEHRATKTMIIKLLQKYR